MVELRMTECFAHQTLLNLIGNKLAPTVLALMDLPQPPEMSGRNLVEFL